MKKLEDQREYFMARFASKKKTEDDYYRNKYSSLPSAAKLWKLLRVQHQEGPVDVWLRLDIDRELTF